MPSMRVIKKYPNRRLYDTEISSYITLEDVRQLIVDGEAFVVRDARSGNDITRPVLMQIIRFYGNAMQGVMGSYLEKNIQAFMEIQERMTEQSKGVYGGQFGPEAWAQFMSIQAPVMQTVMNSYIDQSKNLFVQMQDQMQDQTRQMFSVFPFAPPGKDKKD